MGEPRGDHTDFPFAGALVCARALWALGEDLDAAAIGRQQGYFQVSKTWSGRYAEQAGCAESGEGASARALRDRFHGLATSLASRWVEAFVQEANARYADAWRKDHDSRGIIDKIEDALTHYDFDQPRPTRPPTPLPPTFAITAHLPTY